MVPQTMFQVKKDPSDSCTLKNLPCSAQGRGVFRIWGKSGLVKAWFKQNTSFVALLYRRGVSEPGFPAWGLCFHAGRPWQHGKLRAVALQRHIRTLQVEEEYPRAAGSQRSEGLSALLLCHCP